MAGCGNGNYTALRSARGSIIADSRMRFINLPLTRLPRERKLARIPRAKVTPTSVLIALSVTLKPFRRDVTPAWWCKAAVAGGGGLTMQQYKENREKAKGHDILKPFSGVALNQDISSPLNPSSIAVINRA